MLHLLLKWRKLSFDYVEDKASAFLMFNDMLELFRNVHPDGSLEQGQMYLVGDSFVATTSVKVGETYLAKDIVGVASPDDMKAKVETTPMLALRRSRAAALIAAGFGLPFEIREAKKAEYEKEHGMVKRNNQKCKKKLTAPKSQMLLNCQKQLRKPRKFLLKNNQKKSQKNGVVVLVNSKHL